MFKLFSFYNSDSIALYVLIFIFVAGAIFYLYKFHQGLITRQNLKILLCICGISILLMLIYNYIKVNPSGDIYYTRFRDAGTLAKGSNVIYRGVNVGKVNRVSITPDSKFALIEFIITDKNTRIPEKSFAEMSFRSITDMQPLIIKPPAGNRKYRFLYAKSFIESKESVTVEETQKLIAKMIEEGKVEEMINDMSQLVKNSSEMAKNFSATLVETKALVKSVKTTNENINKVIQNGDISSEIKSTVSNANRTVKKFENVADKTDVVIDKSRNIIDSIQITVDKADSNINNEELFTNLQDSARGLKQVVSDIQEISSDNVLKGHIRNSIIKSSEVSSHANCLTEGLGTIMGKKYLIPRIIFGQPGKEINQCNQQTLQELKQINNPK